MVVTANIVVATRSHIGIGASCSSVAVRPDVTARLRGADVSPSCVRRNLTANGGLDPVRKRVDGHDIVTWPCDDGVSTSNVNGGITDRGLDTVRECVVSRIVNCYAPRFIFATEILFVARIVVVVR
jgi:hypothetical protein